MVRFLIVVPHAVSDTDPISAEMAMKLYRTLIASGMKVADVLFGEIDRKKIDLEARAGRRTAFRREIARYALERDLILLDIHSTWHRDDFPEWFIVDVPGHDDVFTKEFINLVGNVHHGFSSNGNDLIHWWERRGLPGLMIEFRNDLNEWQKENAIQKVSYALGVLLQVYNQAHPYADRW